MAESKPTWFQCMRCSHLWEAKDDPKLERVCPQCKSNSVRKLRRPPQQD